MSFFKTKWFILKKSIINKNELITIFTYDYWKIVFSKKLSLKEKNLDIWSIINLEIKTKEWVDIHTWTNIRVVNELNYQLLNFETLNSYLELITSINKNIPINLKIPEIFNIIELINNIEKLTYIKIILANLKIFNILWILNLNNSDPTVWKILNFINNNKINQILLLTWINQDIEQKLSKIITWKNH